MNLYNLQAKLHYSIDIIAVNQHTCMGFFSEVENDNKIDIRNRECVTEATTYMMSMLKVTKILPIMKTQTN